MNHLHVGPLRLAPVIGLLALAMLAVSCSSSEPQDRAFNLDIVKRSINLDSPTLKVNQGDTVTIVVTTDEPVAFHLHGYDIEKEAKPGQPATLEFTANATGSFPFAIHVGAGGHHHGDAAACEPQLPSGAPTPGIRLTASPGEEPGTIDVAVEVENFILSSESADTELATGHWHLFVNGQLKGMYVEPEVTTTVPSPGEYQVKVSLSDIEHCDYGIDAMTTVLVPEGYVGYKEEEAAKEEEIELGRLEVQPR